MNDPTVFSELRPLLFSIAYRMLGSVSDAEDMVQEAFLRWERVTEAEVESPKAYLSSVVTRLSIDHLRSARVARETYVGPWLPEPVLTAGPGHEPVGLGSLGGSASLGGEERVELADSLSMAFLVLLESLTPVERAVFLLRETFGYGYDEIGAMVGRSEANCRQIAVRARKQIEARRPRFEVSSHGQDEITERFMEACTTGDLKGLTDLLADDIMLWSDGGGKVRAARKPIAGREAVARFLLAIARKWFGGLTTYPAEVNGQPGFLVDGDGHRIGVVVFDVAGGQIHAIRIVVNPDKLEGVVPS
jgi:RNA polymerase sigma-70 factor (ECF subfamily)